MSKGLLLVAALAGFAALGDARAQDPVKYWVFFTEKSDQADKTAAVTPRALERRARRGRATAATLDRPVSDAFLANLEGMGLHAEVASRWLNAASVRIPADRLDEVTALEFVRSVRPVGVSRPLVQPESTIPRFGPGGLPGPRAFRLDYGPSLRQLEIVNAVEGLENGLDGSGVILGVIDTPAGDLSQPSVSHIVSDGRLLGQENFTGFDDDPSRHALAVLSVAAGFRPGTLIGPAYGADILLAHTEYSPTETNQEEDNFVAALEWMESQGVDVVNVSLGYSLFDDGQQSYAYEDMDGDTAITTRAADLAASLGVVMVNSAGNEGNSSWRHITSPADGDSVIAVGAVDRNRILVGFSSRGPSADGRIKPDVSAMGAGVVAARTSGFTIIGDVGSGNGTSFSSPMVAGIVTHLLQVNPELDPHDVWQILTSTADLAASPNNGTGYGIVNAAAALAAAETWGTAVDYELPRPELEAHVFPNPSNGPASVRLEVAAPGTASVHVYDVLGRVVAYTDFPGLAAGAHRLPLDLPDLPPGWYGWRVTAGNAAAHGTLTIVP